jgi:hypothetical protein
MGVAIRVVPLEEALRLGMCPEIRAIAVSKGARRLSDRGKEKQPQNDGGYGETETALDTRHEILLGSVITQISRSILLAGNRDPYEDPAAASQLSGPVLEAAQAKRVGMATLNAKRPAEKDGRDWLVRPSRVGWCRRADCPSPEDGGKRRRDKEHQSKFHARISRY